MALRKATGGQIISVGEFLDDKDGNTQLNSLAISNTDINIRKNTSSVLVSKNSGGAVSVGKGVYVITLDAIDTSESGNLEIYIHMTGSLVVKAVFDVLAESTYDAQYVSGLNNLTKADVSAQVTTALTDYTVPTTVQMELRTLPSQDYALEASLLGLSTFNPLTDAVARVSLVDVTTTNTDMRGTNLALLASDYIAPNNAGINETLTISKELQANQGNWLTATGFSTFDPLTDAVSRVLLVDRTIVNSDMVGTDNALLAANYIEPDNVGIANVLLDTNELQANQGNWVTATGFSTKADIDALNNISVEEILTTKMTESYAPDGEVPTLAQSVLLTLQNLQDFKYVGVTQTVNKIDGLSVAATYTLDDPTNPTSKTRAT